MNSKLTARLTNLRVRY